MTTLPELDREATRLFGLTVQFDGKGWNVMQDARVIESCAGYEDATQARLDLVNLYLPKMDQISIDSFLKGDRIADLRSEIIQNYDAPVRAYTHHPDLIAFEVEFNGRIYGGEAYDDEELALHRLRDALDAATEFFCDHLMARDYAHRTAGEVA